jgi:hypothetical protein
MLTAESCFLRGFVGAFAPHPSGSLQVPVEVVVPAFDGLFSPATPLRTSLLNRLNATDTRSCLEKLYGRLAESDLIDAPDGLEIDVEKSEGEGKPSPLTHYLSSIPRLAVNSPLDRRAVRFSGGGEKRLQMEVSVKSNRGEFSQRIELCPSGEIVTSHYNFHLFDLQLLAGASALWEGEAFHSGGSILNWMLNLWEIQYPEMASPVIGAYRIFPNGFAGNAGSHVPLTPDSPAYDTKLTRFLHQAVGGQKNIFLDFRGVERGKKLNAREKKRIQSYADLPPGIPSGLAGFRVGKAGLGVFLKAPRESGLWPLQSQMADELFHPLIAFLEGGYAVSPNIN